MPSYTTCTFHVVFGTKYRRPSLNPEGRQEFLAYCCGIAKGLDSHVYRINCVEDHLHLFVGLPPTLAIAEFVKRFKNSSGNWLREHPSYPHFDRWQAKYGAFAVGWDGKARLIEYIKNQEEHHRKESFADEFKRLLREAGLEWDPRDEE